MFRRLLIAHSLLKPKNYLISDLEKLVLKRPTCTPERISEWVPPFSNDFILKDIFQNLPGKYQNGIPFYISFIETNLPGGTLLYEHDCIHVILGRGLLGQDEAFTLGFTMGNDSKYRQIHGSIYKFITKYIYQDVYRFTENECKVFDLGVEYGKSLPIKNIHKFDFDNHLEMNLGCLREKLGVKKEKLKEIYKIEKSIINYSKASLRLPC